MKISKCGTVHGGDNSRGTSASTFVVAAVGLRILMRSDDPPNNVVVKSSLTKGTHLRVRGNPSFSTKNYPPRNHGASMDCYFLQSCALCRKKFGQYEDIYMCSGEGFCSIECRERKIKIEEMKKLQESMERMSASPRHCSRRNYLPAATEVRLLREELRRRCDLVIAPKTRTIIS